MAGSWPAKVSFWKGPAVCHGKWPNSRWSTYKRSDFPSYEDHCVTKCLKCWLASRLQFGYASKESGESIHILAKHPLWASHETCRRVNPLDPRTGVVLHMILQEWWPLTKYYLFPPKIMGYLCFWTASSFVRVLCSTWLSPRKYPFVLEHWWHGMLLSKARGRSSWRITLLNSPISEVLPSRTKETHRNSPSY
jgi:hypothetical protein